MFANGDTAWLLLLETVSVRNYNISITFLFSYLQLARTLDKAVVEVMK